LHSFLILSISLVVSSIALKILEESTKLKLIIALAIIINIIISFTLFSSNKLRSYEWLGFTPLIILAGIALVSSISKRDKLSLTTILTMTITTIVISMSIIFKAENPIYYYIIYTTLFLSSIGVIYNLIRK